MHNLAYRKCTTPYLNTQVGGYFQMSRLRESNSRPFHYE